MSRFLLVRAGDALCALPLHQVRRVVRALTVHALPGSSAELLGLAEFAGEPLPVLELATLAGGAAPAAGAARVTVVARLGRGDAAETVGLHAEEALEIVELAPPSGATRGVVAGEALAGERRVAMLDLAAWQGAA
jgi:chemotaxis signal transduction protein